KKCLIIISLLMLLLFMTSCNPKKSNTKGEFHSKSVNGVKNRPKDEGKILTEFNKIASEDKEPYEIAHFIDENISVVSKDGALEMIEKFEKIQESYIEFYSDELFKDDRQVVLNRVSDKGKLDMDKINSIEDEEFKKFLDTLLEGKYKLSNIEGAFYPVIDYSKYKEYNKYLPEEMVGYIEIKNIEEENPFLIGTSLVITWDELGDRIIAVEEYLRKYPDTVKIEDMLKLYGDYLLIYLQGVKDTQNYDYDTKVVYDDVIASYKKLVSENKNSITKDIVEKYLEVLEENENKMNEEVEGKIVDLYNEAISRLEEL